jgi:hypothetical protein
MDAAADMAGVLLLSKANLQIYGHLVQPKQRSMSE